MPLLYSALRAVAGPVNPAVRPGASPSFAARGGSPGVSGAGQKASPLSWEPPQTDGASEYGEEFDDDDSADAVGTEAGACAMLFVASIGDIDRLDDLYQADKQVILYKNGDSRTSVHVAVCEGHIDAVRWLLARGCDVNARDKWKRTPLDDAIRYRFYELQDFLVEKGGVASTPLPPRSGKGEPRHMYMSIPDDLIAQCNLMVAAGAGDLETLSELCNVATEGEHDMHMVFAKDYDARTALHMAAASATGARGLATVKWLVENGANVNARDRWDKTPFMRAVGARNVKVCDYLLQHGAEKPDVTVEKSARIHEVLRLSGTGNIAAMRAKFEVDPQVVNFFDFDDRSVLHYAAFNNQIEMVKWLITHGGANPNPVNRWGATPLLQCIRTQKKELIAFLMANGGKLWDAATRQLEEAHTLPAATCRACRPQNIIPRFSVR